VNAYFPSTRPHILAHRGLALAAVENSLEAFRSALSAGATHIETDAHATSDGVAILFHDDVLAGRPINAYAHSELPDYIPTLGEALEAFPDARFNIDIKSPGAIYAVAASVKTHHAVDRVLIASFSEKRRSATHELLSETKSSASASSFAVALVAAKLGMHGVVRWSLRKVDAIQIPLRALGMSTITPRTIRAYRHAGVFIHVWTVNDPREMRRLVDLGVDGIVTDRTDLAHAEFSQA
jgi:glycerophosphoryl diester phosphodiesterase